MSRTRRWLSTIILLGAAAAASAGKMCGDSLHMMKPSRDFGFLSAGIAWVDQAKLNTRLHAIGLTGFGPYTTDLAFGGHKEFRRLIMENTFSGLWWRDNVNGTLRSSLWVGNLLFNTGINVLPADLPLTLFPFAGLGAGLNVMRVRSDTKTISDLLTTMEPNSFLCQGQFLLDAGLGADYLISNKEGTGGLAVGVRGGYVFNPYTKGRWYSDGIAISDVPALVQNGPYVRLLLAGWGMHRHHNGMMRGDKQEKAVE